MKLSVESGLWSTGTLMPPTPLVAVVEVSGAVLSWAIDDAPDAVAITFTDVTRADWLWRLLGESGHSAVAAALEGHAPDDALTVDVRGVALLPGSVDTLRRLALGHWLRRWWPASHRDGIVALDAALLDVEVALLTSAAQEFFADDTFDSDVAELLEPHRLALNMLVRGGDPRVVALVMAAGELTDEVGVELVEPVSATPRRDDYALAAGVDARQHGAGAIAHGTDSLPWAGVPPGVFDAAEDTVDWLIAATASGPNAAVAVDILGTGSPEGIAVRIRSEGVSGSGVLDADGRATFPLTDARQQPLTESAAWNHDWRATTVTVGTGVEESPQMRQHVRDFARTRLAHPPGDAFLAEILAAESDY